MEETGQGDHQRDTVMLLGELGPNSSQLPPPVCAPSGQPVCGPMIPPPGCLAIAWTLLGSRQCWASSVSGLMAWLCYLRQVT